MIYKDICLVEFKTGGLVSCSWSKVLLPRFSELILTLEARNKQFITENIYIDNLFPWARMTNEYKKKQKRPKKMDFPFFKKSLSGVIYMRPYCTIG